MTEAAELHKLDALPAEAKARALAMLQNARTWGLGALQGVDVKEDAGGWHITLRLELGAFDFVTPAAR